MRNVIDIIRKYSKKGYYIEVLADGGYEYGGVSWRGYVSWYEDGEWSQEDCGCYKDWEDAFDSALDFILSYEN